MSPDKAGVKRLAKDLRTKTSARAILKRLEALTKALEDQQMADKVALAFMRAGGLPTLIRHLKGSAPSAPTSDPRLALLRPSEAGLTLLALLRCQNAMMAELQAVTGVITPLIEVLSDRVSLNRCVALSTLLVLAMAQPGHLKAMAEEGLMRLLLEFYIELGDLPPTLKEIMQSIVLTAKLAQRLLESGPVAARELEQTIRSAQTVQTFGALVLLQVTIFLLASF